MQSLIGGAIIGAAVSIMLLFNGRVTGISGIIGELLNPKISEKSWRAYFLLGLFSAGLVFRLFHDSSFTLISKANSFDYMIAGLLVGFGTLMGNGCTSGHGVCGLSRFSPRSFVATLTFIGTGILSLLLFKFLRGGL